MSTYHNETSPKHHAWQAGDVVRLRCSSFADAVVLGFDDAGLAQLARPYVYASSVGTTAPTPLTGVEIMNGVNLVGAGYDKVSSERVSR